jgi:NAD(P)-dependent dehydrogenase (short-subunit alcohol dehydrogenase family)
LAVSVIRSSDGTAEDEDGATAAWPNAMRLDGKVAIVTGGVQGLGGAHTEALVSYGAHVVVADIRDDEGASFAGQLNTRAGGKRVHYVHLDVRDFAQWERAVAVAESEFGRLTTLVNNAGFPGRTGIEETTEEGWSHTLDVDLKGTWLGMKACVPAFRRAGGGAVVNTSSCYAVVSSGRGSAAYGSAKAGVLMLSKGAAVEYAEQNIRINCVIPGVVDTPRNRTLPPEWSRDLLRHTPMGRMARPEEISNAVVFLASDAASFITGTSLVVDGGFTAI